MLGDYIRVRKVTNHKTERLWTSDRKVLNPVKEAVYSHATNSNIL